MQNRSAVNIVIIGAGDIARKRHIPAIQKAPNGVLYGFYDTNAERAHQWADEFGTRAFETLDAVLQDPEVDAVLISTPPVVHVPLSVAAIEAGKHVLLEKPMATTVEEARQIEAALAAHPDVKFMMLHIQRFYAPHQKAKELLDRGEIGKLLTIRSFLCNSDKTLLQGIKKTPWHNSLHNVGIHRLDLMRWLVGDDVKEVFCHRSCLLDTVGADDHTIGILQYENGVVGTMICSRTSFNGEDRSTVLIGTGGTITTYARQHEVLVEKLNGERQYYDFPSAHPQAYLELTDAHERFFQCILDNTPSPISARDGEESIRILSALDRSDAERRWVSLSEF